MRVTLPFLILAAMLSAGSALAAPGVTVGPLPHSDRLFPYLEPGPAFAGTPLAVAEARLPGAVIVVSATDGAKLAAPAGAIAFMLGQMAQTPAVGRQEITSRRFAPLVASDQDLAPALKAGRHLILLAVKSPLIDELRPRLPAGFGSDGPALHVVENSFAPGKHVMILSGRSVDDVLAAADYLAYDRLLHRSGAYDGLFSFVRLRAYLEQGNFQAAKDSLADPLQLRGCAKPVVAMLPRMAQLPAGGPELAAKRNSLVFKDIRAAIARADQPQAIGYWKQAMETCYACHAGRGGPQVVKFKRNSYPHRLHQTLASDAGMECASCHQGPTEAVGYAN